MAVNLAGNYTLLIGASLEHAFQARRAAEARAQPRKPNPNRKEFVAFRYTFKPESVDSRRQGSIKLGEVVNNTNTYVVEQPSTQNGDSHYFTAIPAPPKEDCVLIFDDKTGHATIERLDLCLNLKHDRAGAGDRTYSPLPTLPSTNSLALNLPPSHTPQIDIALSPTTAVDDDLAAEIEAELANFEPDDDDFPPMLEDPDPEPEAAPSPLPMPALYTLPSRVVNTSTPDEEILNFGQPSRVVPRLATTNSTARNNMTNRAHVATNGVNGHHHDVEQDSDSAEEEILQFGQPTQKAIRRPTSRSGSIPPMPSLPPMPSIPPIPSIPSFPPLSPGAPAHPSLLSPAGSNSDSESESESGSDSSDSEESEEEPTMHVAHHHHGANHQGEDDGEEFGDLMQQIDQELMEDDGGGGTADVDSDSGSSNYDER